MSIRSILKAEEGFFKHLVDEERASVLSKLQQLEESLVGLKYESKVFSFDHIKKIENIIIFLRKKYHQHELLDKSIIFPFLLKHIPRLTATLNFLEMESQDFQGLFETFDKALSELKIKNRILMRSNIIEVLRNKGVYLICLVRSHIQLEKDIVYKAIFQELHKDERTALQQEIEFFLLRNPRK